jgi:membrane-bound lytic murein transglycosylase MltF
LQKQDKPEILVEKADKSLIDEDLLEMVNAGILPATITLTGRASSPKLLRAQARGRHRRDLAFAMRKNNPQFKQLVDEFVKTHAMGTSFGNTLWRRYLQSDQWVKNPTSAAELKNFEETVDFFKSTLTSTASTT